MAKSIQELREDRDALYQEACALSAKADEESRLLTDEEQKTFDGTLKKVEDLDAMIGRREKLLTAGGIAKPAERLTTPDVPENELTVHAVPATLAGNSLSRYRHGALKAFKGPNADEVAYKCGRFLLASVYNDQRSLSWCVEHGLDPRRSLAQGENVNTAGGVLVPDEFEAAIIDLRELYGVFRRECMVTPMAGDTKTVPRRTGGLTAYATDENPSTGITQSQKAWDFVKLVAKKIATLTLYSSEIAEDAVINMADDLAGEIAYAFANYEDNAGFKGDGTSTYAGINGVTVKINDGNHGASLYTAASGGTSFGALVMNDFHTMTGKLPEYARRNAKWFIHRAGFAASMERLAYAQGGTTVTQAKSGDLSLQFLGYPVVISQVLNSTLAAQASTVGGLIFGDLRMAATMGSRKGVTVAQSDQRYFELDQIGIRGTQRFDISVHDLGDGTNPGPLIVLKFSA